MNMSVNCTCGFAIGDPRVSCCSCNPKQWIKLTDKEIMQMSLECLLDCKEKSSEYGWSKKDNDCVEILKIALTPPKKQWVGLTEQDKKRIINSCERDERNYVIAMTEALLKDKNT